MTYGGTIEYILVSGEGDGNNSSRSLFGYKWNLKTAVSFEQALKDSYLTLMSMAKDSRYNTAEKSFSVKLLIFQRSILSSGVELFDGQRIDGFSVGGIVNGLVLFTRNIIRGFIRTMKLTYVSSDELLGTWLHRKKISDGFGQLPMYTPPFVDKTERNGLSSFDVGQE